MNAYYGANEASLSFDELIQWADERSLDDSLHAYTLSQKAAFTSISKSTSTLPQSRQYALSLTPSLIPSVGPLISSLISSGVARYGGYRLLERVGIYDPSGTVKDVPGSKEEIFKNRDINLVDKRRLMRFLMFAAGEFENTKELEGRTEAPFIDFLKVAFSLTDELAGVISYALAFCVAASGEPRLRHFIDFLRQTKGMLQMLLFLPFFVYVTTYGPRVDMVHHHFLLAIMVARGRSRKASAEWLL